MTALAVGAGGASVAAEPDSRATTATRRSIPRPSDLTIAVVRRTRSRCDGTTAQPGGHQQAGAGDDGAAGELHDGRRVGTRGRQHRRRRIAGVGDPTDVNRGHRDVPRVGSRQPPPCRRTGRCRQAHRPPHRCLIRALKSALRPAHHFRPSPPERGDDTRRPTGFESGIPRARSVDDRGVPVPVDTARAGPGHGPQPDRVLRPPHELRPRRPADRAARRVLRRPGGGRHGADHHRGALDPPDRLAVREADPRLPPRRDPRLPAHHRRRAPAPGAGLRPDQPQRRPGVVDVHPAARVGAVARGRSAVPGGAQGGHGGRDRRDRRRLRARRRALRRGRLRRHRAAVQPLLDRARLPLPRHQPAHRRLRRQPRQPGPAAPARSSPPCAASSATGWRSACACAATS